jgi:hypothetical protein
MNVRLFLAGALVLLAGMDWRESRERYWPFDRSA